MAVSVNGLICDADGNTPWCESEWDKYQKVLGRAGCLIVGRRTHEIMSEQGEYNRLAIRRVVVLTSGNLVLHQGMTTACNPSDALAELENEGFKEVVVGGGADTNAAFLRTGKVNEIYLDVEPHLFGKGKPISQAFDGNIKLQLVETEHYSPNSIGLRYLVLAS